MLNVSFTMCVNTLLRMVVNECSIKVVRVYFRLLGYVKTFMENWKN